MRAFLLTLAASIAVLTAGQASAAEGLECAVAGMTEAQLSGLSDAIARNVNPPEPFAAMMLACAERHGWNQESGNIAYLHTIFMAQRYGLSRNGHFTPEQVERIDAVFAALDLETASKLVGVTGVSRQLTAEQEAEVARLRAAVGFAVPPESREDFEGYITLGLALRITAADFARR